MKKKSGLMKNLKSRVVSLALAVMMIAGLTAALPSAVQAESILKPTPTTGSLTIQKTGEDAKPLQGAEFTIYKVIGIAPQADGKPPVYTTEQAYQTILQSVEPDALGNYNAEELDALALKLAEASTAGGTPQTTNESGVATFNDLALGYYLVMESAAPAGYVAGKPFLVAIPSTNNYNDKENDPDAPSKPGETWVYDVTVKPKNSKVNVEKDLGIVDEGTGQKHDGTAKVGDYVPFVVTTTIPNYTDDYTNPTFKIYDYADAGLQIMNDTEHPVEVKVKDAEVLPTGAPGNNDSTYTLTVSPNEAEDQEDLLIVFDPAYIQAHRGEAVKVTYWAQITEDVKKVELNNKVELEYDHKPGDTVTKEERPRDEEKVYSFQIKVEKFTNSGTLMPLKEAEFEIYKDAALKTHPTGFEGTYTSDDTGKLDFKGLEEGIYYLKETKSPAGYTLLTSPIKVEITLNKDGQNKVTGFAIKVNDQPVAESDTIYTTRLEKATGAVIVAVENYKGFSLPATGGMGILLFLLIGAAGIITVSAVMLKKSRRS